MTFAELTTMRAVAEAYLKENTSEVYIQKLLSTLDACTSILKSLDSSLVTQENFVTLNEQVTVLKHTLAKLYLEHLATTVPNSQITE